MISTSEAIDTSTAMGRMFFVICAALNECESEKTSERIKIGMERATKEGIVCNRPKIELSEYQINKAKEIIAANPEISGRALAAQFDSIGRNTLLLCLKKLKIWPVGNNREKEGA